VRPFAGSAGKWVVSTGSGSSPVWSKTAPAFFFVTSHGMEVVRYRASRGAFEPGTPRLFIAKPGMSAAYDVSPVGDRFVIVESVSNDNVSPRFTLVLNFFDELRRRLPAR